MSKPLLGYYYIEKYMRICHCWPTSHGFRGFTPTIVMVINFIFGGYLLLVEIKDYKIDFAKVLFHTDFAMCAILLMSTNIQLFRNRHRLVKISVLLSDIGKLGVSKRIEVLDKNIKTILKIIRYGAHLFAYFITYSILLEDDCAQFKNSKYCFMVDYYLPRSKHWDITLMMLFQIYSLFITIYVTFIVLLFMCYSMELLIVRIEILKEMIDNITLTKNKKKNFKKLRPIMIYHQELFRMFQFANKFITSFLVSTKLNIFVCLTLATTEFALEHDLTTISVIILNFFGLFLYHTFGQRFITAAGSVADSIYNMNWFDADVSTRKDVLILFCLTQKELKMELPLIRELSHTAAFNEYKKCYAFFTWILKITKQRNL